MVVSLENTLWENAKNQFITPEDKWTVRDFWARKIAREIVQEKGACAMNVNKVMSSDCKYYIFMVNKW